MWGLALQLPDTVATAETTASAVAAAATQREIMCCMYVWFAVCSVVTKTHVRLMMAAQRTAHTRARYGRGDSDTGVAAR